MSHAAQPETSAWLAASASWLTARRLRAHAVLLALCLWGVCAVDFSTPGFFDRAGNIKFQDFLPFYVSAQLIAQGRADQLYDQQVVADEIAALLHPQVGPLESGHPQSERTSLRIQLPILYPPQVGFVFVPLARLPFRAAAWLWVTLSMLAFAVCIYGVWKSCPGLRPYSRIVAVSAIAFPPLFHFFVRGQISVLVLACFTAAFLAMNADRSGLAGIALGILVFKPQFLIAIPLVLLLAQTWKVLAGVVVSAGAQLAFAWIWFGSAVMGAYFDTLWRMSRWIGAAELAFAPVQMHSLRSFWMLLIPWPGAVLALYVLSSVVAIATATLIWRSASPLALRFSALTLAAVLVNPHLFVYDLLALAPLFLLLADWTLTHPQHPLSPALRVLSYLAYVLPLFGPLARWTHVQFSVAVFAALLWMLWRLASGDSYQGMPSGMPKPAPS